MMEENLRKFHGCQGKPSVLQCHNVLRTTTQEQTAQKLLYRRARIWIKGESHSAITTPRTLSNTWWPLHLVIFISSAYEGRCSDKYVTSDSGFLEYLCPGDEVNADCDLLHERKVTIPAFTKRHTSVRGRHHMYKMDS
jgi:hypothetical protein